MSAWVLVGAMASAVAFGFVICLLWTGRKFRSEHSFYDPAVSVSATIERVNSQLDNSEPAVDGDPSERYFKSEYGGPDDVRMIAERTEVLSTLDARPYASTESPVVRYYFTELRNSRLLDTASTIEQPGGAPLAPDARHTSGSPQLPRHALREEVRG